MSHLPGVLFFWKDPERPINMILLQSDQSKSFGKEEHLCYWRLKKLPGLPGFLRKPDNFFLTVRVDIGNQNRNLQATRVLILQLSYKCQKRNTGSRLDIIVIQIGLQEFGHNMSNIT
ncbi:hypothetical protein PHYBLDRAFT_168948 [Phycomyces blakesleeanus NRRL 1555(-)]|uniref:Uncharacterized protein n=1 Tax=Phycomyces blakesleeanus (strain ATCC 8743b / DSM 1359 / FGSC 10004 / NBRC 33097 / NRRL 1555) TaxID=763407 RepID=A0A162U6B8_PHYB8|nr:hypothetical protein PHYBLDRAFT_168948 [Phycomyces blakesleeanus NRRL 1555(-)]OAD72683.1 hypothetical protein PHYBLDRAFT_168948 [Phycomyces blakesleeanus NRRL 1555(-)]|eukprot:XP_018290723.1 hypothetical protein PHYBLDRAFT_168948 [Phycomyces blakesleeanus NRRL 1555(-)]